MLESKEYGSIKLNKETIFHHYISQNKEKLDLYNQAVIDGKIIDFDQVIVTRLRKLYYGMYSGLIYMYFEPTHFNNIGNKAELMTHVLEDKQYQLVHGDTDSTRNIPFFRYGVEHLDYNSWFEVQEGQKVWVYDLFSMLKIEKSVYNRLENPTVTKIVSKDAIMSNPGRDREDYTFHADFGDFMLIEILPKMEQAMASHPFSKILAPEITRYKKDIDFDNMITETHEILEEIQKKSR